MRRQGSLSGFCVGFGPCWLGCSPWGDSSAACVTAVKFGRRVS